MRLIPVPRPEAKMTRKSTTQREGRPPITNYKDLRLRRPRSDWRVGRAEKWIAGVLGIPSEAVQLMLPKGDRRARADKTIGALRRDWQAAEEG